MGYGRVGRGSSNPYLGRPRRLPLGATKKDKDLREAVNTFEKHRVNSKSRGYGRAVYKAEKKRTKGLSKATSETQVGQSVSKKSLKERATAVWHGFCASLPWKAKKSIVEGAKEKANND